LDGKSMVVTSVVTPRSSLNSVVMIARCTRWHRSTNHHLDRNSPHGPCG
jgi:hypothetical protein